MISVVGGRDQSIYENQKRIGLKQRLAKSHKTILEFGMRCKFVQLIKIGNPDPRVDSEALCGSDRPIFIMMMIHNSSWLKLQHFVALLVRFCHWLKNRKTRSSSTEALTTEEVRETTLLIMRLVPAQSFAEELRDLKANNEAKSSST